MLNQPFTKLRLHLPAAGTRWSSSVIFAVRSPDGEISRRTGPPCSQSGFSPVRHSGGADFDSSRAGVLGSSRTDRHRFDATYVVRADTHQECKDWRGPVLFQRRGSLMVRACPDFASGPRRRPDDGAGRSEGRDLVAEFLIVSAECKVQSAKRGRHERLCTSLFALCTLA